MSNYDKDLSVPDWDIKIDTAEERGYFEWVGGTNEDDETAGGLWFSNNMLVDYDGVFDLPSVVKTALAEAGYDLNEPEYFNDSMDGDHDSAMASAGYGTDEDYGG